jgi:Meiotically up-regulated gene 113
MRRFDRDKFDSVYLLQEIDEGRPTDRYKIGYTTGDTESRMKQYRAGNSRTVVDFYTIRVDEGMGQAIEAKIHNQFPTARMKNRSAGDEWFKLSLQDVQMVARFMTTFECDPTNMVPAIAWDLGNDPMGREVIGGTNFATKTYPKRLFPNTPGLLNARQFMVFRANEIRQAALFCHLL